MFRCVSVRCGTPDRARPRGRGSTTANTLPTCRKIGRNAEPSRRVTKTQIGPVSCASENKRGRSEGGRDIGMPPQAAKGEVEINQTTVWINSAKNPELH
ncbi:hypothetical protein DA2_2487 [Desulfovibrio sp. A2]|nr:hypothetical protein DA2_2487 [Desulfovibrio sp. A2]